MCLRSVSKRFFFETEASEASFIKNIFILVFRGLVGKLMNEKYRTSYLINTKITSFDFSPLMAVQNNFCQDNIFYKDNI